MSPDPLVCLCTCPDPESATRLASALVEASLAACVSQLPGAVSTYRWQGRVEQAQEILLVIKTTADRYPAMAERLLTLHPYDVPELLALPVVDGHAPYLAWLRAGVADDPGRPGP